MRKRTAALVFLCVLSVLLSCGCGKKPPWSFEPLREGSRAFRLESKTFKCAGTVEVTGCGLCAVSFTAPDNLTYVTIVQKQNELTVTVGEHSDTMDLTALPDQSLLKLLLRALEVYLYHNLPFEKGETDTVTAAAAVLGHETVAVYQADGALKSIRCDALGVTVAFS